MSEDLGTGLVSDLLVLTYWTMVWGYWYMFTRVSIIAKYHPDLERIPL